MDKKEQLKLIPPVDSKKLLQSKEKKVKVLSRYERLDRLYRMLTSATEEMKFERDAARINRD